MFGCTAYFSDSEIKEYSHPDDSQRPDLNLDIAVVQSLLYLCEHVFHMRPHAARGDNNFPSFLFILLILTFIVGRRMADIWEHKSIYCGSKEMPPIWP